MEFVNIITLQRVKPIKEAPSIHLPLGISFFTFHGLSYIIDVYRNQVQVEWHPVTLAFDRKVFAQGVVQFILGLSKKVLVANTVGAVADSIFNLPFEKLDGSHGWLGLLTYTLQNYFDFSGYWSCSSIRHSITRKL